MTVQELENIIRVVVDQKSVADAQNTMNGLKSMAKKLLGAVGITVTLAGVKQFTQECVQVASDVSEMESKFDVVFGGMSDEAEAWANDMASYMGRSVYDLKTYIADAQNLLVGFSDGNEEARATSADLAEQMTETALNIASFANTEDDVAIRRMTQAVMGSSEAAKMLGAVLTDSTRALAMQEMGLSGTYDALDQYTKMQVNLRAIQDQSKDAIDDCHNSMFRYESRTRQLSAAQKDLKVYLGTQLLPAMTLWNELQVKLTDWELKLAKAVFGESEEDNKLQQAINWLRNAYSRLSPVLTKVKEAFIAIIDKLGGMENTIKIVTILIGALALIMNFEAGVKAFQKLAEAVNKFNGALGGSKKVMALAAAITLLVLIVEDFVNFMQGNDSLIGELFKQAGIDADDMRQKISGTLEDVEKIVGNVIEGMRGWFDVGFEIVKGFFSAFDIDIGDSFGEAVATIINLVSKLFDTLASNPDAAKEFGKGIGEFVTALTAAKAAISGISAISKVVGVFSKIGKAADKLMIGFMSLPGPIQAVIIVVALLVAAAILIYKNWDKIKPVIDTVVAAFKDFIHNAGEVCQGIQDYFANLGKSLAQKCGDIHDAIVNAFQAAIDWITSLPSKAFQWGSDIINSIVNGILSVADKVGDAVKGVADKIKSFLGFSEPEEGPLSDFHTYMPDMMDLMANGITGGKDKIRKALEGVTGEMSLTANVGTAKGNEAGRGFTALMNGASALAKAKTPAASTISTAASSSWSNRSVVQNVNINNKFEGEKAAQKNAASAMDKSAKDITSTLAHGLAYAR